MKTTAQLHLTTLALSLFLSTSLAQPTEGAGGRRPPRERAATPEGSAASAPAARTERRRRADAGAAAATPAAVDAAGSGAATGTAAATTGANPALFWSLLDGSDDAQLEAILRSDPGLAKASKDGYPALHLASTAAVASLLLKAGADPNVEDQGGRTALQEAVRSTRERGRQVALVLLQAGAHTNHKPGTISLLLRAAETGDKVVMGALLARGLPVDDAQPTGKDTPLIQAVRRGHKELAEFLLSKGAAVNHKGDGGSTALARAAFDTRIEIVQLLLAHRADINATDSYGATPLAYLLARRNQPPEVERQIAATAALLRGMGAPDPGAVQAAAPRPVGQGGAAPATSVRHDERSPAKVDGPPQGLVRYVWFFLSVDKEDKGKFDLYDANKRKLGTFDRQQFQIWHCYVDGPPKLDHEVVFKVCGGKMKDLPTPMRKIGMGVYVDDGGVSMDGTVFHALKVHRNRGFDDWGKPSGDYIDYFFRGHEVLRR